MKWVKHMTASADDPALAKLLDTAGLAGYGFYWRIVEIVAAQADGQGVYAVAYPCRAWCMRIGCHPNAWRKLLGSCQDAGIIDVTDDGHTIRITIPNLAKLQDDYTRKSGQSPDKIRTKYGESPPRSRSDQDRDQIDARAVPPHVIAEQALARDADAQRAVTLWADQYVRQ